MNRNLVFEELLTTQALFEAPHSKMTVLKFVDRVRELLDAADDSEPQRCAWCLSDAYHDAELGLAAGDGGIAVTIANGHALCYEHFGRARRQRTTTAGTPALAAFTEGPA